MEGTGDKDDAEAKDRPTAAGVVAPVRDAEGTPAGPSPQPGGDAHMTEEAQEAVETELPVGRSLSEEDAAPAKRPAPTPTER